MKFVNRKENFRRMIEVLALLISFGAIFLQIWILLSSIESYLSGKYENLLPSVVLSALGLLACGLAVGLTKVDFLKGLGTGRTRSYQK